MTQPHCIHVCERDAIKYVYTILRRNEKIDFQDGCHGGHLGLPIGTILAIFDLQITLMLPTKFRVN